MAGIRHLKARKQEMRQVALKRREKLATSMGRMNSAESLTAQFFYNYQPKKNTAVSAYWPFRNEIDVRPLLKRLNFIGCCCLLPVIMGRKKPLQFHRWKPGDTLKMSRFGLLEPSTLHPNSSPEIVVVPLLAFDSAGYRLGYGGGYYDCTLAVLRKSGDILAIGAAYEDQQVDSVPHDQFDQQLDAVVTEQGIILFEQG